MRASKPRGQCRCKAIDAKPYMKMSISIDAAFGSRKAELLTYLRSRTKELLGDTMREFGTTQFKKRASAINKALAKERAVIESVITQTASKEEWSNGDHLCAKLLLMHCTNVVMLESRNTIWRYEYMAFSRRIGELWEPFVTTCFELPVADNVSLFVPPLFHHCSTIYVNVLLKRFATS